MGRQTVGRGGLVVIDDGQADSGQRGLVVIGTKLARSRAPFYCNTVVQIAAACAASYTCMLPHRSHQVLAQL